MKKVIAIVGSLRKQSIHRQLLGHYRELAGEDFQIEEGEISEIPLYNQDLEAEGGAPESVTRLAQQIQGSDGVIFFTPEYNYSIPGVLKNALDWLSRSDLKPFHEKKAAIIGASPGNVGTARMQYHLRQVGVFLNIQFLNKPEVMIGKAFDKIKDGCITDEGTVEFLKKHSQSFSEFISR